MNDPKPVVVRQTTAARVLWALAVAGLIVGGVCSAAVGLSSGAGPAGERPPAWAYLTVFGLGAVFAGLLGGPPWFLLHRLNKRSWTHALLCGAVLGVVTAVLAGSWVTWIYPVPSADPADDTPGGITRMFVTMSILCALIGSGVTWLGWRIAYRREPEGARAADVSVF